MGFRPGFVCDSCLVFLFLQIWVGCFLSVFDRGFRFTIVPLVVGIGSRV